MNNFFCKCIISKDVFMLEQIQNYLLTIYQKWLISNNFLGIKSINKGYPFITYKFAHSQKSLDKLL